MKVFILSAFQVSPPNLSSVENQIHNKHHSYNSAFLGHIFLLLYLLLYEGNQLVVHIDARFEILSK